MFFPLLLFSFLSFSAIRADIPELLPYNPVANQGLDFLLFSCSFFVSFLFNFIFTFSGSFI
jgi:hypothetical protein